MERFRLLILRVLKNCREALKCDRVMTRQVEGRRYLTNFRWYRAEMIERMGIDYAKKTGRTFSWSEKAMYDPEKFMNSFLSP